MRAPDFLPLLAAHALVTVNAALNATATVLLIAGYLLIKRRREVAHRNVMLAAFGVSVAFLGCYLYYHIVELQGRSTPFTATGPIRRVYFAILISHIILAATVPFLAAANSGYRRVERCREAERDYRIETELAGSLTLSPTGL